ncbi:MAG: hypothetical protein IJL06_11490 [Kiritimatiellae bacterium]|nr:hypothetical protein [Kiritimatiellia bacterium]
MRPTRFQPSILCLVAAMAAVCASAAINDGIAVTALPVPDGDGAYVFGNANYTTTRFDDGFAAGLAYPVWDAIGVPAGSSVKFIGGVALSSLPAGCTFDFSGATHVFVTDAAVFGSGFAVPKGVNLLFQPCNVTVGGTTASFAISAREGVVGAPIAVDGTFTVGREANVSFGGAVTGSDAGLVYVNGFGRRVTFGGLLAFDGKVQLNASQRAARIVVSAPGPESRIGIVEAHDYNNSNGSNEPQQLLFLPASATPCTLVVTNYIQHEAGGLVDAAAGSGRYRRWGVLLSTCSNNTIRVQNIANKGAHHLIAASNGAYTCGNEPAFDEGFANFEFVHLGKNAQGHADRGPVFYPSPNVNLSFTGRFTGNYQNTAPSFDYTAESNAVNRGSLDMSQAESYKWVHQPIVIRGHDPWNLPRTIRCHANLAATTTNVVTGTRWLIPLDFGAETNEIDVARCETDAILSVPASGTVVVSNATTVAGARVVPGRYPVITGSSGAAPLANWSLEVVGKRWAGAIVSLESDDMGLWIVVKVPAETLMILR